MRHLARILALTVGGLLLSPLAFASRVELADKKAPSKAPSKKKKTNPKGIDSAGLGEKPAPRKKTGK